MLTQLATLAVSPNQAQARVLIAHDEFSGPAGSSPSTAIWNTIQGGGWGNGELQSYTARTSNLWLTGSGALAITARKEVYRGSDGITSQYTSGRLISRAAVKYGYLEARIYLPVSQGLWPAFWTIGSSVYQGVPWPRTGEIDIMESYNRMTSVYGSLHGPTTTNTAWARTTKFTPARPVAQGWHVYAVNWTASAITWYLDGSAYATVRKSDLSANQQWAFDQPQLIQLNLAVGGDGPGAPDSSSTFPTSMQVDYVRVYSN